MVMATAPAIAAATPNAIARPSDPVAGQAACSASGRCRSTVAIRRRPLEAAAHPAVLGRSLVGHAAS